MEIICPSCRKHIDIPDEKIPQASKFTFVCPYCRERVTVDRENPPVRDTSVQQPVVPDFDDGMEVELDSFPPGTKVVFIYVMNQGWKARVEAFFRKGGYSCVLPGSMGEAMGKLRFQHHDVVIIENHAETAPLFDVINGWRGLQRRERNVVLLGSGVSSLRPDEAFIRGVNACLNLADEARVEELLDACMKGYELAVSPWIKAMEMESGYV